MAFVFPELTLESILVDGFENARRDESVIDDVFANFTRPHLATKYGEREINKIKKMCKNKEVSIVHSFHAVEVNMPCVSIQMTDDREDEGKARLGDDVGYQEYTLTDPEALAALIKVDSFTPTAYDTRSGLVSVPDDVDLSPVYKNLVFVDANEAEHTITGPIVNETGKKRFGIAKGAEVALGPNCQIKSSFDYETYRLKGNVEKVQLLIGVHSKDALTTKYLYTLVKYFLLSRKKDLESRDVELSAYSGSDFSRNMEYKADMIFTKFLTLTALIENIWRSDLVALVDNVELEVYVEKDEYGDTVLGRENQTIKVED